MHIMLSKKEKKTWEKVSNDPKERLDKDYSINGRNIHFCQCIRFVFLPDNMIVGEAKIQIWYDFLDKLSSLKSSGLLVSLPQWTLAKLNVLSIYRVVFGLERAVFLDVGSAVNHWANLGQFPLFSVQWEMRCAFIGQKWCYIYVAALGGKASEFSSSVPIAWRRGAGVTIAYRICSSGGTLVFINRKLGNPCWQHKRGGSKY